MFPSFLKAVLPGIVFLMGGGGGGGACVCVCVYPFSTLTISSYPLLACKTSAANFMGSFFYIVPRMLGHIWSRQLRES